MRGHTLASRNLWISIPALVLAFAVWMIWSVVVVHLPQIGFQYSYNQLFWLTALPGLSSAALRIFYALLVPVFGGRTWTTISTASLLIPAFGIGWAVQDINTSYPTMLLLALLCGLGGGNFASSMANISFFFPHAEKARAMGMNAGLGNLGVALMQGFSPLVLSMGVFGALGGEPQTWMEQGSIQTLWLQNAGFIWLPLILASSLLAWFGMHDLAATQTPFIEQVVIVKRQQNWLICWLYLGTFGSFIGYAASLPLLIKIQFPDIYPLHYAFFGPIIGGLARILGAHWLAQRTGQFSVAKLTCWIFISMIIALLGVIAALPNADSSGNFTVFFAMFMLLFAGAGLGNAAIFHMVPLIFTKLHQPVGEATELALSQARQAANLETSAVLGFASAVAALGTFFVPKSFGTSLAITGWPDAALWTFIAYYCTCVALTWLFYARNHAKLAC